jgi:hypothetical protein
MTPGLVLVLAVAGAIAGWTSLGTTMIWWRDAHDFTVATGLRPPERVVYVIDAFVAVLVILVCVVVGFDAAVALWWQR